ncbi:related to OTU1 |uniref:Ubiquitin thioesterase OTU n=2 Tax=Melanopsichium pennsylvanicum TaxID=63383 RepID=A0AAJ5C8A6_9BASI|nr:cysteine protease [Melanopsichium pennsylvanicum 4]SNX87797.1 related to OTU1 \
MIRIRHPQGTASFPVNENTTLSSLQSFIAEQCSIPAWDQEVKIGYPPKGLHLSSLDPDTLLSADTIGIKKGEQVIVALKAGSSRIGAAAQSSSALPTQASSIPSYGTKSISSFGTMQSSKTNVSTATGPRVAEFSGLGARTLNDGLTPRNPTRSSPSPISSANSEVTDGSVTVPLPSRQGKLTLKVVPDDNSCLFNSIGYLFQKRLGSDICSGLRQIVASAIRSNPEEYPDIVLGQSRDSYISKILSPQTWGGAIELSILSKHFGVELVSIDVASGTTHRFGEDVGYENRGLLVYSGIHYDALTLLPGAEEARGDGETTIFPNLTAMGLGEDEDVVLSAAKELCAELKRKKYYTDTANFALKCKNCGKGLKGEKEAVEHAKSTGHGDFGEV